MANILLAFLFFTSQNLFAVDLKFRYIDGYCQKNKMAGSNPSFVGECGNLVSSRVINQTYQYNTFSGLVLNSAYLYMNRFDQAKFKGASFRRAVILQNHFENLNADFTDFKGAIVKGTTFKKVSLQEAFALGTRFEKTKFEECDLRGTSFWGSNLLQTEFINSDLRGVDFRTTFMLFTQFTGSKFNKHTKLPFTEEEAIKRGMIKVD